MAGALTAVQCVLPSMQAAGRGTIIFTGGGFALEPAADYASVSLGKAALRNLAFSLAHEMRGTAIHAGTVTICGMVKPGTHFDPNLIAETFVEFHKQPRDGFDTELMYR